MRPWVCLRCQVAVVPMFAASYEGAIDRLADPVWTDVYRSRVADP